MRDSSESNPIPVVLRSSHLFVLVGRNPLPVWVVARLLLQEGGQLYLVHSPKVRPVAEHLARRWRERGGEQPIYVGIPAYESRGIDNAMAAHLEAINAGSVGLNYTGGTKVMALHAYRAMERRLRPGVDGPIFSYLDPERLLMRFDQSAHLRDGAAPIFVGRAALASLSVKELFDLHDPRDLYTRTSFQGMAPEPPALPVAQAIAALHATAAGTAKWRELSQKLRRDKDLTNEAIGEWPAPHDAVGQALLAGRAPATTWAELIQAKVWPFKSVGDLTAWLDGAWLESYVYDLARQLREPLALTDVAQHVSAQFSRYRIEVDVVITRGYQMLFISCYSGTSTNTATAKLMEAAIRARQVGGDEAGAALVCMSLTPSAIEDDVRIAASEDRIRVFGQPDFPQLADKLHQWIRKCMPQ